MMALGDLRQLAIGGAVCTEMNLRFAGGQFASLSKRKSLGSRHIQPFHLAQRPEALQTRAAMETPCNTPSTESPIAETGLSQLYRDLRVDLTRFLTFRLGDASEAEEIIQELYLRIHGMADGPIANGRGYLYRAAQNLAFEKVRERQRRIARDGQWLEIHHPSAAGVEPADDRPDAETGMIERERASALAAAIAALPPRAGRVFRMHKLDGVPHAMVARELGITISAVEKHLAAAMVHLRRAMEGR